MTQFALLYSTFSDQKSAEKVADKLLKLRLIGCAVFLPASSKYWWKGQIESAQEVVMLAKTTQKQVVNAKAMLTKFHPYETPCIVEIESSANAPYLDWLAGETTPKPKKK